MKTGGTRVSTKVQTIRPICPKRSVESLPLGTAVAGECALLISVDRDLVDMQAIQTIPIIRPGEYWRQTAEIG
jgi:hypothetical protein